jgi:peptide/nickel transport system ATP-binding protein
MNQKALLSVENLSVLFDTDEGLIRAVDGVSFSIKKGETLGIVGESGSGKSVTALSIMGLINKPIGEIASGKVFFEDRDLVAMPKEGLRRLRGNRISMIFQEPMTSLNPVFTIGDQIMEVLRLHLGQKGKDALDKAIELLKLVGLPSPEKQVSNFPHQLSGGMRQRVMIAMALSCQPDLLIADEPTTALDVTIEAQIMDLMKSLQAEFNMAILLITHDMGIVAEVCDRVVVMYAGQVVEESDVDQIFASPRHPYTLGLLRSIPGTRSFEELIGEDGKPRLRTIPGVVPNLLDLPTGCRFYDRCLNRDRRCQSQEIGIFESSHGIKYRCLYPNELGPDRVEAKSE